MIQPVDNRAAEVEATARMVREEIVLRPARRAAAFLAVVLIGITGAMFASGSGDQVPGVGFEIRAEITAPQTDALR